MCLADMGMEAKVAKWYRKLVSVLQFEAIFLDRHLVDYNMTLDWNIRYGFLLEVFCDANKKIDLMY